MTSYYSFSLLKRALIQWWRDDPFTQSAAVAFFTIFSFPALMILYFSLASFFMEEWQFQHQVYAFFDDKFGENSAENLRNVIEKTAPEKRQSWAFVVAVTTLLYAALRLFIQLQKALNYVWRVDEAHRPNIRMLFGRRLMSFAVMIGGSFALAASFILTSTISSLTGWFMEHLPAGFAYVFHAVNIVFSVLIIGGMFTVILKKLPDVSIKWREAWPGGLFAACLFMIGEYALGHYFALVQPTSAYGVSGSVILLMIWVSYSCAVLLLGAQYIRQIYQQAQ